MSKIKRVEKITQNKQETIFKNILQNNKLIFTNNSNIKIKRICLIHSTRSSNQLYTQHF